MDDQALDEMTLLETATTAVTGFATLVLVSTIGYYWELWTSVREQLW